MSYFVVQFIFILQFAEVRSNLSYFSGNSKGTLFVQEQSLYPAYEGFYIRRGFNVRSSVFFLLSSPEDIEPRLSVVAEPFFSYPAEENIFLHRFSSALRYGAFALEGGKNTVKLGPGIHNSLILSHNIEPQKFFLSKIEDLELPCIRSFCLGKVGLLTGLLFADDDGYRFADPTFWFMSVRWSVEAFTIGASRIVGFGGRGGWSPKRFKDYVDLFTAKYENAMGTCDWIQDENEKSRCYDYWASRDTNQVAEIFGVVNFPPIFEHIGVDHFEEFSLYFEYGGDDIVACWQVEDVKIKRCLPLPFGFTDTGWIIGFHVITQNEWGIQFEYTWFNKMRKFYAHSNYPMVIKGRYLGAHTGPLSDDVWLKISKRIHDLYVGAVFHYTSRWEKLYPRQENIYEFNPRITFDFDGETKTIGFSPAIYLVKNPDRGNQPFEPELSPGTFVDFSLSFVFISRF